MTFIYILLIYSRAILSFAWLTGYAIRSVLLSDTLHTDSFTANVMIIKMRQHSFE